MDENNNISMENWLGKTPLHIAVEEHDIEKIKFLLSNGANVNEKDSVLGCTPLHLAVFNYGILHKKIDRDIIKLLLSTPNINVNIRDNQGRKPFDIADKETKQIFIEDYNSKVDNILKANKEFEETSLKRSY